MKNPYRIFWSMVIFFGMNTLAFSQIWPNGEDKFKTDINKRYNFYEIQESFNKYWEGKEINLQTPKNQRGGWMQFKRWEWFWEQRTFPDGNFPDPMHTYNELMKLRNQKSSDNEILQGSDWENIGPETNTGGYNGLGRLNCIEEDPDYDGTTNRTIWVGSASGGLWKTTDDGATWTTKTDKLPSLGISGICINPSNKNIMYIATGDGDVADTYSVGVLKSTDGGENWNTTGLNWTIQNNRVIRKLIMHPSNYDILYAATSIGIFKTTNGGNSWTQMSISLTYSSGFWDIEFKPGDPNTLYATSTWEIVRTTNAGTNWSILTSGLPSANANTYRAELTVSAHDANYIYAVYGYYNWGGGTSANNYGLYGVYRSTNSGTNWTTLSNWDNDQINLLGWESSAADSGGQAFYDLDIVASPTDKNVVFIGGVNVWRTTNSGSSWSCVAHWYGQGGRPEVHADHHHLRFAGTSNRLYSGHDGGIDRTTNNGSSWTWLGSGLKITQFYRLGVSQTNSNFVIAGSQDNGTKLKKNAEWFDVIGGDGMECIIDYTDTNYMWGALYYGQMRRSTNAGKNWSGLNRPETNGAWVTPYVLHPTNPQIMYAGYRNVWVSTNRGTNWSSLSSFSNGSLTLLHVAPSNTNHIYAGYGSILNRTTNGGTNWSSITLPTSRSITYMAIHPDNPNRIWATFSGYTSGQKVYYSTNGGTSWTNITGNLPNIPVNTIVYQKNRDNRVYVGTDLGVFYRDDKTTNWIEYNQSLPNVIVNELEIHQADGILFAATYGRGVWKVQLPGEYFTLIAPTLNHPLNNSTNIPIADTLKWQSVQGAETYQVQVSINSSFGTTIIDTSVTDTTYFLSNASLNYSTNYYWRVRAKSTGQDGPWSSTWLFTTEQVPLVAPVLTNPSDNATNIDLNINLTWNAVQGAQGYQIQVSHTSNFDNPFTDLILGNIYLALLSINPEYSTTYYWRVRAQRGLENGPWANHRQFTTKPIPLVAPELVSPADNASDVTISSALSWNSVAGADNYTIQISPNSSFNELYANITQSGLNYSISNFSPDYSTEYHWRVRSKRGSEDGPWSESRMFITEPIPLVAPALTNPADNDDDVALDENLAWNSVQGADNYQIQIALSSSFSSTLADVNQSGQSYSLSNISPDYSTEYFWRVRAKRGSENGPWASYRQFTTMPVPLVAPVLTAPDNNATKVMLDADLTWQSVSGAESYELQLSRFSNFSSHVINSNVGNVLLFDLGSVSMNFNTLYYWRVRAIRGSDSGPYSTTYTFTTRQVLQTPASLYPPHQSKNIMNSEIARWSEVEDAEKYHVQFATSSNFSTILYENANLTDTMVAISLLNLNINQNVIWRVRAINSLENSNWSTLRTFSAYPSSASCDAKALVCGPYISDVTFGTLQYQSGCDWGYADNYASQTLNVNKKQTYQFSASGTNTTANSLFKLWIDWNGDNDFDDEGESLAIIGTPGSGPFTANITVPSSAITGKVRARMAISNDNISSYCGIIQNGEFEDFALNIAPAFVVAPDLISPLNNAKDIKLTAEFVWDAIEDALSYNIQISDDQQFNNIVYQTNTASTSVTLSSGILSYRKTYYWRVNTVGSQNTSDYSTARKFDSEKSVPDDWTYISDSEISSVVRVPIGADIKIGNRDIDKGDAIGLFFDDNGTLKCSGYGIWNNETLDITVWGDDTKTSEKDGYDDDEAYKFKTWDSQLDLVYPSTAKFESGPEVFQNDSLSILSSLESSIKYQTISLSSGWNLISSYITPINASMTDVWNDIKDDVVIVKDGLGKTYLPAFDINGIGNWKLFDGYQVYMSVENDIVIGGNQAIPENEDIELSSGWSLISYLRNSNMNAVTAFATLTNSNSLVIAKDNFGRTYIPMFNINGIGNLLPGQGYQVYLSSAATLTYPANQQGRIAPLNNFTNTAADILEPAISNTGDNMTIILELDKFNSRFDIGVFNQDNLLAGSAKVIDNRAYITVWNFDKNNNSEHKYFELRAYDKLKHTYMNINLESVKDLFSNSDVDIITYRTNFVYFAKGSIDFDFSSPSISAYPNPFNDKCEIAVFLPEPRNIELILYNSAGKEVYKINHSVSSSGLYNFIIEAGILSSGEYLVVVNYGSKTLSEKIILSR
ncbi:MAG: T9SS type A sorting domain-containing protein [Candidatus Kapabacteria bacterium]|nr:T9SS type A sorting domain-containing protein [Candidatus Kapabacteria bacterium]